MKRTNKAKTYSTKQLKKTRWKKSLSRAMKRGPVYGGFVEFTDELLLQPGKWVKKDA